MTNLDQRPVKRVTRAVDSTRGGNRPLIVMLEVGGRLIKIKPKGTRQWYPVAYEDVYRLALQIHVKRVKTLKAMKKEKSK